MLFILQETWPGSVYIHCVVYTIQNTTFQQTFSHSTWSTLFYSQEEFREEEESILRGVVENSLDIRFVPILEI